MGWVIPTILTFAIIAVSVYTLLTIVCYVQGRIEGRRGEEYGSGGCPVEWAYSLGWVTGTRRYRKNGTKPAKLTARQKAYRRLDGVKLNERNDY